jgi:hypothetical protein
MTTNGSLERLLINKTTRNSSDVSSSVLWSTVKKKVYDVM